MRGRQVTTPSGSRPTVDKLGVKLYDKISAVVAELVANGYDADAEDVRVNLPLGTTLARRDKETGVVEELGPPWTIQATDDGHGMTPAEARKFYLDVGRDRRTILSRELHRRGYRYRVDIAPIRGLRCRADMVFRPERLAVFVDGCFGTDVRSTDRCRRRRETGGGRSWRQRSRGTAVTTPSSSKKDGQ